MDEEIKELMEDYSLDEDTARRVKEIIEEEDIDAEDAIEIAEDGL